MTSEIILNKLLTDKDYFVHVFPYLKKEDFRAEEQLIFDAINDSYYKYKKPPTYDELNMYFEITNTLTVTQKPTLINKLNNILKTEFKIDADKLIDYTEKHIINTRYDQALELGIDVREGTNKKHTVDDVQVLMQEALKTTFKSSGGHDYIKDSEKRFLEYAKREEGGIDVGLEIINLAAGNGLMPKTLTVPLAESNSGKCQKYNTKFKIYINKELKKDIERYLRAKQKV